MYIPIFSILLLNPIWKVSVLDDCKVVIIGSTPFALTHPTSEESNRIELRSFAQTTCGFLFQLSKALGLYSIG